MWEPRVTGLNMSFRGREAASDKAKLPPRFRDAHSFDSRGPLMRIRLVRAGGCGAKYALPDPQGASVTQAATHTLAGPAGRVRNGVKLL